MLRRLSKQNMSSKVWSMARYVHTCLKLLAKTSIPLQIAIEETTLDAAKSSIVYATTKGVSTPGRAVSLFPLRHLACP